VEALWYRPSGWLVGLRPLRGRFGGKGAIRGKGPLPVADSPETTPPIRAQVEFGWDRNTALGLLRQYLLPAGPLAIPSPIVPEVGIVAAHAPQSLFAVLFHVVFHKKVGRPHVLRTLNFAFDPS
jgi:hypothetical protein